MTRQWTPEQKKAWGEKMKAARAAKAEQVTRKVPPQVEVSQSAPETIQGESDYEALKRRVDELSQALLLQQTSPQGQPGAQVTSRGIVGTVTKYSVNPKDYPDPRERLFDEPKLKLKGFTRDWWDLEFNISSVKYDTKDGLHITEPKFQLKLIRIIEDEETGEPSAQRYVLWKGTFFEDPEAALQIAFEKGLEVNDQMEKTFLDEMRYLRMRDWLLEAFYPPKPQQKAQKQETVIGNRVVEVYEVNSVNSEKIPFGSIKKASF